MPRRKVNKSERVRAYLTQFGVDAPTRTVLNAMAAKRLVVSTALVSKVKERMRKNAGGAPAAGRSGRRRTKPEVGARDNALRDDALVSLTGLHLANDLIDCTGSLSSARATLELVATLRR